MKNQAFRRFFIACMVVVASLSVAVAARADSCDASRAQNLARQGYSDLNQRRWSEAKQTAGSLIMLGQDCDQADIRIPAVVHSAYIGSAALHGLGDDAKAAEGIKAGLMLLDVLQKSGEYKSLYDAMQPRFIALQRELKT